MVRIVDVAKIAKVSTATVSRVLCNTGTVSKETTERVQEAMELLNYQPNVLARQLRKMETNTILVVVPDITNSFFSKVLRGIESVAIKNGYQVLLGDAQNNHENEKRLFNILRQKKADGMILLTANINQDLIEKISKDFAVVLACEYIEGSPIPTVSIDNISSARKATNYLIELGHKRIGFISGPLNSVLGRDRLKGFRQAMNLNNYPINSLYVQEGDFSYDSGLNLMQKFLALDEPPTAVFTANDEMAIGAIKAIKTNGLKVPDDISIIGFDNVKFASITEPPLTTIAQPAFTIGENAMKLLMKLLTNDEIVKTQFILEDQLIIRDSCRKVT